MSIDEAARVAEEEASQEDLRARLVDLEVLYRLADAIGRSRTIDETLDEALAALTTALGLSRAAVLLADGEGVMRFAAWRGLSDAYRAFATGHSPWAPDAVDPQPVLVAEVDSDPALAALRDRIVAEGIRALAFVPMVHQGRLLGKFMLYRAEPGQWSERELRLTQAIATHIAAATERHRTFDALEESRRRLAVVLRDVADGITVQGRDGKLQYANDAAARTLGFPSAEALLSAPVEELVSAFEILDERRRPLDLADLPGRLALAGETAAERVVLYRIRATGEERWSTVRATPVLGDDGRVEAAVNVFHDVTERRRAEEAVRFIAEAGVILSSSLDFETTLASVARLAVPAIADWCIVYMREEDGTIRRLAIEHSGDRAEEVGAVLDRFPLDPDAVVGVPSVVKEGIPLLIPDLAATGLMADVVDPEGLAAELGDVELSSYLCVPLIARGRTLGAIALVAGESGRTYGDSDVDVAMQLAGRAALAVDNARLYRDAESAAALERRRSGQLLRLSQAALLVNSTPGLDEVLGVLTAQAREIVGVHRAATSVVEGDHGEPAVRATATSETGSEAPTAPAISAPLVGSDGRMLGTLELIAKEEGEFTTEDDAILVQLTQMASVAIENIRLFAESTAALRALESQRALFEAVLQQMASGVVVTGPDGRVLISNDQAVEIFGDPLEVDGLDDYGAYVGFHPDGSRFAPGDWPLARSLEHGESVDGQLVEIERGDGTRRVISVSSAPVRSGAGLVAAVATFSDVTDRARAQRRLAFLAEASTLLASSLDYEDTLAAVSRIVVPAIADWCSISILEDDDTIKIVAWTHSDPERQRWADEMRAKRSLHLDDDTPTAEVIRTGEPVLVPEITGELVDAARPEDVELVQVMGVRSFMVVPFKTGAGTFGSIMFVSAESGRNFDDDDFLLAREIGRRAGVAIENARLYRATEQRARAAEALEFVADGVFTVDRDGIVRLLNPAAASALRLGPDAVGRPVADLLAGWAELAPLVPVVPVDERRVPRAETLPVETTDGEAWLSISGVSFAEGTVYAFRDVTEERGVERLKSDFVSTVSHELRTPLAAIYGAALTLRRADMPLPDEQRQDLLGVIADEADRLARIVNDILWTSRIEAGVIQVQIESCDARELARSVVHAARLHLPDTHAIELQAPDDLPRVAADPDKVRQVLSNLVDNAVKYSPGGGGVAVRIEAGERVVRFVVEDDGLGIPAGDRDRVFEKFYRLDPDLNRGVGGTGLGLYICRELVRRMEGWIWVEERTPSGSRFVVELPALA